MRKLLLFTLLMCTTICVSCQNEKQKVMQDAGVELTKLFSEGITDPQKMSKCEIHNDSTLKLSIFLDLDKWLGEKVDMVSMRDLVVAALKGLKPIYIPFIKEIKSFEKLKKYKIYLIFSVYDLERNHWVDITISSDEYSNEERFYEQYIINVLKEQDKETKKILPVTMEEGRILFSCDFVESTKTIENSYMLSRDFLIALKEEADMYNVLPEEFFKQFHVEEIEQGAQGIFAKRKSMFIYKYKYYDENKKLLFTIIIDKNDFLY